MPDRPGAAACKTPGTLPFHMIPKDTDMTTLLSFIRREDGATAIEYGLIAALVSVAIVGALTLLGTDLSALFGTVTGAFPE